MIIRSEKNKDYTVMSNVCFKDNNLSAKAKGIFGYIMTLPDEWKVNNTELVNHFSDGLDSIKAGIKELINNGYCKRVRNTENGKVISWELVVMEKPQVEKPQVEKPQVEKPQVEKPQVEKPPLINTNSINYLEKELLIKPNTKMNNKKDLKETPIVPYELNFDNTELREVFVEYLEFRLKINLPNTKSAIKSLLDKLYSFTNTDEERIKLIESSIEKGYRTFYDPRNENNHKKEKILVKSSQDRLSEFLGNDKKSMEDAGGC